MVTVNLLGHEIETALDPDDVVLEAVLLLRVFDPERPHPVLVLAHTKGIDGMLQIGMLESARDITRKEDNFVPRED